MEVWPGRPPGAADAADEGVLRDDLPDLDQDRAEVAVARRDAIAMIDLDHVAVAAGIVRGDHRAARGRPHGVTCRAEEVDPGMHGGAAEERIHARAERAGYRC